MPKVEHAATGATDAPVILPTIEICAAGMLAMFQSRLDETAAHGSSGQAQCLFSARILLSFWRIVLSFAEPDDGGTGSDWIAAASFRYCRRPSLCDAQYCSQSCLASIHSSEPGANSAGSAGAIGSALPPRCARSAAQRSSDAQNSFHLRSARS